MAQGSPGKYFAFQVVEQSKEHPDLPPYMCQSPRSWMLCCITSNPGPISSSSARRWGLHPGWPPGIESHVKGAAP